MSYSIDFRKRVLEQISQGMSWDEAVDFFGISRNSIGRWSKKEREEGVVSDSPRKEYKVRKIDKDRLLSILKKSPDSTLEELSQEFNCWPQAIHKRLLSLGVTRKKNVSIQRTRRGKKTRVSVQD